MIHIDSRGKSIDTYSVHEREIVLNRVKFIQFKRRPNWRKEVVKFLQRITNSWFGDGRLEVLVVTVCQLPVSQNGQVAFIKNNFGTKSVEVEVEAPLQINFPALTVRQGNAI